MTQLILLRHGQSQANAEGLFTGLLDVPLTEVGRREAVRAGELLDMERIWPQVWFSSPLLRAHQTMEVLRQNLRRPAIRIDEDWRLAERNYGCLTGRSKSEVMAEYGEELFHTWRRSVEVAPPPMSAQQRALLGSVPGFLGFTESLNDVISRVSAAWHEQIRPAVLREESALVIAHGNSLRALCCVLDDLSDDEVQRLNLPTAQPLIYQLDRGGHPLVRHGRYLDPAGAAAASERIAREGEPDCGGVRLFYRRNDGL